MYIYIIFAAICNIDKARRFSSIAHLEAIKHCEIIEGNLIFAFKLTVCYFLLSKQQWAWQQTQLRPLNHSGSVVPLEKAFTISLLSRLNLALGLKMRLILLSNPLWVSVTFRDYPNLYKCLWLICGRLFWQSGYHRGHWRRIMRIVYNIYSTM